MQTKTLCISILVCIIIYIALIISYAIFVINKFSGCDGNLTEAGLFGDMFGGFNSFFTGLAFFALILSIFLQQQENRRLQDQLNESKIEKQNIIQRQYLTTLITTQSELTFYRTKFNQLSDEVKVSLGFAETSNQVPVPTYKFYPNFLENQKIELSKFHFNSSLIKDTGNCHFELCHIIERLNLYSGQMNSLNELNRKLYITNARGFVGLLDKNVQTFKDVENRFQAEIDKIKDKINDTLS